MNRYKKTARGTVIDTITGLEWQAKPFGPITWQAALDRAAGLGDGWRLPSIEELITLIDFSQDHPATAFPDHDGEWYWSSSSRAAGTSYAWGVYFTSGYVCVYDKVNSLYARYVRASVKGVHR